MRGFLEELAGRRRFGMRPGLDAMRALCKRLGDPQRRFKAIHVAGTNGKGAVSAILDSCLVQSGDLKLGRYTSPHLVRLNERFCLGGVPVDDSVLERAAETVFAATRRIGGGLPDDLTFFEALTAVAFELYARSGSARAILECGLGGRLDATNVCEPELCVITRVGMDHCDWLGPTLEAIASEKAGIVKPGIPVVLGRNDLDVRHVVERRAKELGAPLYYAPDVASESDVPDGFSLGGAFNRENAVTAIAALRVLGNVPDGAIQAGLRTVVWPGRFQRVGRFVVDGAHNPPAAAALVASLKALREGRGEFDLVFGACADKDIGSVLSSLAPLVRKGYAVRTANPRSLDPNSLAAKMRESGIDAVPVSSLGEAISFCERRGQEGSLPDAVICGSLFLAGEALLALDAYPWAPGGIDPSEMPQKGPFRHIGR